MVSKRNHLLYPFLNNNSPIPCQFLRNKTLLKKISEGKCSLNKLLNLNRGGLNPLVVYALLQLVIIMQNKNLYEKPSSGLLFTAKILHEAMYLAFPYLSQITKFSRKMQDFKCDLDLTCKLK